MNCHSRRLIYATLTVFQRLNGWPVSLRAQTHAHTTKKGRILLSLDSSPYDRTPVTGLRNSCPVSSLHSSNRSRNTKSHTEMDSFFCLSRARSVAVAGSVHSVRIRGGNVSTTAYGRHRPSHVESMPTRTVKRNGVESPRCRDSIWEIYDLNTPCMEYVPHRVQVNF